jgi:hypothetical protein
VIDNQCYHVQSQDAPSYIGLNDRSRSYFACPKCAASKMRSNLSGSNPDEIAADLFLENCDEDCIRELIHELLEQIDTLRTGAVNVKRFDPLASKPVRYQIVRETRS